MVEFGFGNVQCLFGWGEVVMFDYMCVVGEVVEVEGVYVEYCLFGGMLRIEFVGYWVYCFVNSLDCMVWQFVGQFQIFEDCQMSIFVNFNDVVFVIDLVNVVMLLIDYQSGLFQIVYDMLMLMLCVYVIVLVQMVMVMKMFVIIIVLVLQGLNGLLILEIYVVVLYVQYVVCCGEINVWDNFDFVVVVKVIGCCQLIIVGIIISVCMVFLFIVVVVDGYQVFVVIDVFGIYFKMVQEIILVWVVQVGVVLMDIVVVVLELQKIWYCEDVVQWVQIYMQIFLVYQLLIESYVKVQDVVLCQELLDLQCGQDFVFGWVC